jgi:putative transposase
MPNWRRAYVPGGSCFFTVVTDRRRDVFTSPVARSLLGDVIRDCQHQWPFDLRAIVLLPDHLHAIWSLRPGDSSYSQRWAWIKGQFTKRWLGAGGTEAEVTAGRRRDGRRGVWQPKFWEHTLEDEEDFERHFDDIHYNPVRQGYVRCPGDWRWSSFHRWVKAGVYPPHWACGGRLSPVNFDDIDTTIGE